MTTPADRFTVETLIGGDDTTWRHARIWASVDPAVAATVSHVDDVIATLIACLPDDEHEPAPRRDDWFRHRLTHR